MSTPNKQHEDTSLNNNVKSNQDFSKPNQDLKNQTQDFIEKGADRLRNIKEGYRPMVEDAYEGAKGKVQDFTSRMKDRGADFGRSIDKQVRTSPWTYIGGIAVGCLLLGFFLGRKD